MSKIFHILQIQLIDFILTIYYTAKTIPCESKSVISSHTWMKRNIWADDDRNTACIMDICVYTYNIKHAYTHTTTHTDKQTHTQTNRHTDTTLDYI